MNVSAVIPTYNRRKYIRRSIDSVLAQTVPVDEIVVVDDGSTDGTAEAVEEWYGSRVRVVRQANSGVSGARRRGIQEAQGEWVAFLDSDDEWTPDRNEKLLLAARSLPANVAWIFGDLRVVTDDSSGTTLFEEYGLELDESPKLFADSLSIQHPFQFCMLQASFIRRRVLLELKCFTSGLRSDDDLLAGFQIACNYKFAALKSIVSTYYRTSDLAASSVVVNGNFGPDYHRSRMIAFSLVIRSGRKRPWNRLYAAEARGLCQLLARRGEMVRKLAWEQFRFGSVSLKGVAFFFAAMAGQPGMKLWNALAARRKKTGDSGQATPGGNTGHKKYFETVMEKRDQTAGS